MHVIRKVHRLMNRRRIEGDQVMPVYATSLSNPLEDVDTY